MKLGLFNHEQLTRSGEEMPGMTAAETETHQCRCKGVPGTVRNSSKVELSLDYRISTQIPSNTCDSEEKP